MKDFITPNSEALFASCDSLTIQNAIAEAERTGCRKVVIPRYNLRRGKAEWRISESIKIPDDFTVVLDNCYMVMETGVYDHMFTNALSYSEVGKTLAGEQKNIAILGEGNVCLDGGVHNHLLEKTSGRYGMPRVWRNTMFYWVNVNGLRMENLHIENQRWWAITHICCCNVKIKNVDFWAVPHVPNMDGIDLRIGCHHFELENITGRTGDDVIAMTALNGNEAARMVEGKESDIHDVKIRNVMGDPFIHYVVRLLNHDGNKIYNIDLDTVFDTSDFTTKKRSRCTVGIGSALYSKVRRAEHGETCGITARNLTGRGDTAIRLDNTCCDSTFTNVKTFGDNLVGIGTQGKGCHVSNVAFEDFYFGITQQEIFVSTVLKPENYIGAVVELPNTTGDITLKNLHVDKVNTVMRADKQLQVNVEGYTCSYALQDTDNTGGAKLIIDGEER